jgi:polysaccharide export outer membrane protein
MKKLKVMGVVIFGAACFVQAQNTAAPRSVTADDVPRDSVWASNLGNDPVGPGDLLYVTVAGSTELCRSFRVDPSGAIQMPMSKVSIHVDGLTSDKIAKLIAADLRDEHILVAPIVSVAVLDYRSRQVTVAGAVKMPGVVQAVGSLTLLDALAKSQGLAPEAGPEVVVTRPASGNSPQQDWHIPIKPLMAGLTPESNIVLRGGDEVRVLEAPKVYLVGNLKMPGIYPLNDVEGTTVLKALAMSQGQLTFTTKDAYIYRIVNGSRSEIEVPLRKILRRTAPDVTLQANDIFYVPEATGLHMTAAVLDRVASFGGTVGSGLIIWH